MARSPLEDVLRILPLDAKDTIVDSITKHEYVSNIAPDCWQAYRDRIKSTRLACRALRDLVDGSLRSVDLVLREEDKERLGSGQLPPLHRWPRCSRVYFDVSSGLTPSAVGNMICLAVGGLPLEARQRVTELWLPGNLPATSITSVLMYLPALQSISIADDRKHLSDDPLELRLVFHGLASLPHLTELRINIGPAVNYLPMLAGSNLTSLYVDAGDPKPDADMIESISRLDRLQRLGIANIEDADLLRLLMRSLPPTIQTLELYSSDALCEKLFIGPRHTVVQFHRGFVSAVTTDDAKFCHLAQLVCKMAPGASNGAIAAPPPKSFHVERLFITGSEVGIGPDAVALKQLLQRCPDVKAETVFLHEAVTVEWAMEVAPLFSGTKMLVLGLLGAYIPDINICMEALWPAVAAAADDDDGGAGALQPVGPSLVELALDRMSAAGTDAVGPSAAAEGVQHRAHDVLLRGPSLVSLASDPDALKDCMKRLATQAQAGAAAAAAAALVTAPSEQRCVLSYMPLPPSPPSRSARQRGAVLVRCTTPAAAAALAQAAAVMAAAGTLGAETGCAEEPAGELLVQPLTAGLPAGSVSVALSVRCLRALKQAAQDVCDGKGPGAGRSGRQRLRWLLAEWTSVRDWPRTVNMD